MQSNTVLQERVNALESVDDIRDALNVVIEHWPTHIHQVNTMMRWRKAEELYSNVSDTPGWKASAKKFLGNCSRDYAELASQYSLTGGK